MSRGEFWINRGKYTALHVKRGVQDKQGQIYCVACQEVSSG